MVQWEPIRMPPHPMTGFAHCTCGCNSEQETYVPQERLAEVERERDEAEKKAFDQHVLVGEAHTQLEELQATISALTGPEAVEAAARSWWKGFDGTREDMQQAILSDHRTAIEAALQAARKDPR